jgi:hypothetical protein
VQLPVLPEVRMEMRNEMRCPQNLLPRVHPGGIAKDHGKLASRRQRNPTKLQKKLGLARLQPAGMDILEFKATSRA